MAKEPAPAFQFYPSDWMHDLDEHPLEIEGAWIRICCKLFFSDSCGSATKSLANWARVMRVGDRKCNSIIAYLDNQKIADVVNQNGSITITSRRMVKDAYIRSIRRNAGSKGGNPALINKDNPSVLDNQMLDNQTVNQNPTPSSSSSSSVIEYKENHRVPYSEIRKLWIEILCPPLAIPREQNTTWYKDCRTRWLSYDKAQERGLEWCKAFFDKIKSVPFYLGENDRNWKVTLPWIWKAKNFWKIIER